MNNATIAPAEILEIDLGDGRTVISYENGTLYRVRMPNGEVQGFLPKVEATPENAIDDIIANPPAPVLPVPVEVSPRQIRLWLIANNVSNAQVNSLLADNPAALIEWEYAKTVRRDHPLVASLGEALGMNMAQVDDAFREASTL